ncbi:uncharacterized protein A1O9_01120 [Exophiala aquamarina CBS 119918]|uniref:monoamine oxidase n=1 Tax=Exophiala aquamarina CBS 119918 TaxID=1182545 RepID=A0A072PSR1_9EURO|nr:uncharacterized protein A1O9_01120 [Exophiala aquamarina CBS 119918]KEF63144.1 hypothetical protein A1O9_01120 [Exophiala aquamarina CBS 119918]
MFTNIANEMDVDYQSINIRDLTANSHAEDISLGEYFRQKAPEGFALGFWKAWIHDLTGTDPDDIGLVYWLDFVKSAGGIESLGTKPSLNASQSNSDRATLSGEVFRARKVLISAPTPLYRHIKFSPPLPTDKKEYVESVHLGPFCKCILLYSSPWWRQVGFNGSFIDLSGPVVFSRDGSSDKDKMYAISCLIGGKYARKWSCLPVSRRVKAVKDQLASTIGPEQGEKIYDTIQTIEMA